MKMGWVRLVFCCGGVAFLLSCVPANWCKLSDLGAPRNLSPANKIVVPLTPTLKWEYPSSVPSPYPYPAGANGCAIVGYRIHLISSSGTGGEMGGEVSAMVDSFSPAALQPTTLYFWEVRAETAGGKGPWSGLSVFYTGPVCDASSLVPPIPIAPKGVIPDEMPTFRWDYPGSACMPNGYHLIIYGSDLAIKAAWPVMDHTTHVGSTKWEDTLKPFEDCQDFSWRVSALGDSGEGPFSAPMNFTIQAGSSCPVYFLAKDNMNCRSGPSTLFGIVTVTNSGTPLLVTGKWQTQSGMWYHITGPNQLDCWISEKAGVVSGHVENTPDEQPPSLPVKGGGGKSCGACTSISDPGTCTACGCTWTGYCQ